MVLTLVQRYPGVNFEGEVGRLSHIHIDQTVSIAPGATIDFSKDVWLQNGTVVGQQAVIWGGWIRSSVVLGEVWGGTIRNSWVGASAQVTGGRIHDCIVHGQARISNGILRKTTVTGCAHVSGGDVVRSQIGGFTTVSGGKLTDSMLGIDAHVRKRELDGHDQPLGPGIVALNASADPAHPPPDVIDP